MDVSYSMRNDMEKMKRMGGEIAQKEHAWKCKKFLIHILKWKCKSEKIPTILKKRRKQNLFKLFVEFSWIFKRVKAERLD